MVSVFHCQYILICLTFVCWLHILWLYLFISIFSRFIKIFLCWKLCHLWIVLSRWLRLWEWSTKNERPCLAPDLSGKAFSLSTYDAMFAVGSLQMLFIGFRKFPSNFRSLRGFLSIMNDVEFCQMLFLPQLIWSWDLSFLDFSNTETSLAFWNKLCLVMGYL